MSWSLYTEDHDYPEPSYAALLPSSLKEVIEDPIRLATRSAPQFSGPSPSAGQSIPTAISRAVSAPPPEPRSFDTAVPIRINGGDPVYYQVHFHSNRAEILSGASTYSDGDYVLTEADRGVDLGRIVARSETPRYRDQKACRAIIRIATPVEVRALPGKEEREKAALQLCQDKAREFALPMQITAAEYQFDGKKLTFYYAADRYVDFRNLVKGLFRIFGTRIWMVWYDGEAPVRDVLTRGGHA
jgi:hypothetical protein